MKLHRVTAVIWRYLYNFRRNWDRLADALYWPVMDLALWGLTTQWLQSAGAPASPLLLSMLTAIVFWQILWRANYEISISLLEETWCGNVVNLFATPLTLNEWIAGMMVTGMLKVVLGGLVGLAASWVLFSLNVLSVGHLLVPFILMLVLFGWSVGLFVSSLVLRWGRRIQTLAWMLPWLCAPFSAVYFPVSALPAWAHSLAYALPTTYVFEGMRTVLQGGAMPLSMLAMSFVLNVLYLALALALFTAMFEHRRALGLQKLE